VKPVRFDYVRPTDLAAAVELGSRNDSVVKFIAGGQSLGPMLNLRLIHPDLLIDITAIAEFKRVEESAGSITIGSCITHADIEDGRVPDVTRGALRAVAAGIAYRSVRNRGTIGGSLVHADPSADWISALAALDASVVIHDAHQERSVSIEGFMAGVFETNLVRGELVSGIQIPRLSSAARWGYYKICRKTGEFAHAIGVYLQDPPRSICRAVIGATGGIPIVFADANDLVSAGGSRGAINIQLAREVMTARGLTDSIDQQIHLVALRRAIARANGS